MTGNVEDYHEGENVPVALRYPKWAFKGNSL
jgi:hypothetical protein